MKRKNTIWSLVLALVMVLGVIAPLSALADTTVTSTIDSKDVSTTKPPKTTVTIHKLKADSYNVPDKGLKHDGGKIGDISVLGTNVGELAGVEFTYYKLKDEKELKEFKAMAEDPKQADKVSKGGEKLAGLTPAGTFTSEVGGHDVSLDEGYYWFVESGYKKEGNGPDSISSAIAVPFGISVPVTNVTEVTKDNKTYEPGTVYLSTVHVYPKNVTGNVPTPHKDVNEIGQKDATFDVGKDIDWIIQGDIPANIKDYYSYNLTDKLDSKLTLVDGSATVYYGKVDKKEDLEKTNMATKLEEGTDYTVTYTNNTLQVKLIAGKRTPDKDGKDYVTYFNKAGVTVKDGNKLYVVFKSKINESAIMGQEIKNGVDLTFTNKSIPDGHKDIPEPDKPKVVTGGKLFKKVIEGTETPLEDAVFTIQHKRNEVEKTDENKFVLPDADNAVWKSATALTWTADLIKANEEAIKAGKFAIKDDNKEEYKATSESNMPKVNSTIYLRSADGNKKADDKGLFEIKGLEFSDYTTKVKEGDALVDKYVQNFYALKEVKAPKDYALLDKVQPFEITKTSYYQDPTATSLVAADPQKVDNKKLTIPQTGGMGTMIFMVAGIALMGGAFIAMRKRSAEQA